MSRYSRKKKFIEEPLINLTPLIDVVFSILIMFIVIAPLLEMDQVELARASQKQEAVSACEAGPICIHVHHDNTIVLNSRTISLSQLAPLLKQEKQLHPSDRPQIFHDKRASFGTYQMIKNAAEEAGFQQLDIILIPS